MWNLLVIWCADLFDRNSLGRVWWRSPKPYACNFVFYLSPVNLESQGRISHWTRRPSASGYIYLILLQELLILSLLPFFFVPVIILLKYLIAQSVMLHLHIITCREAKFLKEQRGEESSGILTLTFLSRSLSLSAYRIVYTLFFLWSEIGFDPCGDLSLRRNSVMHSHYSFEYRC